MLAVLAAVLSSVQLIATVTQVPILSWSNVAFYFSLFLYLAGFGFLLLFEKAAHPWRHLGKERQSHCWGKLQGTKKGIETEPTVWDQVGLYIYFPSLALSLTKRL